MSHFWPQMREDIDLYGYCFYNFSISFQGVLKKLEQPKGNAGCDANLG